MLALIPGDRRADETKVAVAVGGRAARVARPDEVVAATGFEPGGVAPFPAPGISQVLMAEELLAHDRVWIGAGSERHMAGLAPLDLVRLTQARTSRPDLENVQDIRVRFVVPAPRPKGRAVDA